MTFRDTHPVKHEAGESGQRFWRGLTDSLDKGAGAERRRRASGVERGNFIALLLSDGRWTEGRIGLQQHQVTFAGFSGESISVSMATARPSIRRFHLLRDGGFRLVRMTYVSVESNDGPTITLAVDRLGLRALLACEQ